MTMHGLVTAEDIAAIIVVVHNREVASHIDHYVAGPAGAVGHRGVHARRAAGKISGVDVLDGIVGVNHKLVIILDRAVKALTLVVRLVMDLIVIHAVVV